MAQKRYNYLPYPINEYGLFRSRQDDIAQLRLARKDQATWNFASLIEPGIQCFHKLFPLVEDKDAQDLSVMLYVSYDHINTIIDGVSIRHQVLHLPPEDFIAWFIACGDLEHLEFYADADIGVTHHREVLKQSTAWTAAYSEV